MATRITRFLPCETDHTAGSAVAANDLIVDNGRLLVAKAAIAASAVGSCFIRGVEISGAKATGAWSEGDEIYYSAANANFSKGAVAAGVYAGLASRDAGSGDTTGYIDLGALKPTGNAIRVIREAIAVEDFTDATATTGYVDLATQIPAGAIPIGWKFTGTGAFSGDTSAVMQVGVSGDVDRFSAVTDQSVFGVATVGSKVPADACDGLTAAQTVRVTVTTGADFTACKTADAGAGLLELFYLETTGA